jgi:hypothetical protein
MYGRDRISDSILATYIQSVPLVVKQPPFSFSFLSYPGVLDIIHVIKFASYL